MKHSLRQKFIADRLKVSDVERKIRDQRICAHLSQWMTTQTASQIFLYSAFKNEPDLYAFADTMRDKIPLALPVIMPGRTMEFFHWGKEDALQKNRFGILEPNPHRAKKLTPDKQTVIVTPVLAVDKDGFRLGFGGGYYDRFLSEHPNCIVVAAAYSEFFVEAIPREDWDQKVSWVCTEKGMTEIGKTSIES